MTEQSAQVGQKKSLDQGDSKEAILQAKNLCKTYMSGKEPYHAIRNVDLSIYKGDFTVIMGDSGSGKSTLLYLLSGLDTATSGMVSFLGRRYDQCSAKELAQMRARQLGFIYQHSNLVPDISLFSNIALPGYVAKIAKQDVKQRAAALLDKLSLTEQRHRLPAEVSGGQQQRAAIARALINDPLVVFADEPTGSLNFDQGVNVLEILTDLHHAGQTVIMVTHDVKAASRGNRLIHIRDGKVNGMLDLGAYTPEQAADRESLIFAYTSGSR